MKHSSKLEKKMWAGVLMVALLTICLAFTTYALVTYTYIVKDGTRYSTGTIEIILNADNDGNEWVPQPIISEEDGFLFEPGVLVEKEFYIRNIGSGDAYYRLYFTDVNDQGTGLADILEVKVTDPGIECNDTTHNSIDSGLNRGERTYKGRVLYEGTMSELTEKITADDVLGSGECLHLYMYFHFPEEIGNDYNKPGMGLTFDVAVDAVQRKNNGPDSKDGIIHFDE